MSTLRFTTFLRLDPSAGRRSSGNLGGYFGSRYFGRRYFNGRMFN